VQGLAVAEAELARAFAATVEARRQQVAANERLHFQQARLAYTRVTAPFDGLIVRRERQAGDIVVPGAPIFLLVSTKEMWITAYVDESAMDGLAPGQPARILFRSKPAQEYPGTVTRLGQEVDRETREFRVDVGVSSLPTNWGVGQRAEVFIETGRKSAVTNIPVRTLVWRKGKPGVLVLNGGRANWKEVSLGLRGVDKVEITRGLSKGDMVIAGPEPSQLTDGQRVYSR